MAVHYLDTQERYLTIAMPIHLAGLCCAAATFHQFLRYCLYDIVFTASATTNRPFNLPSVVLDK